jgi:2-dehydro-3-deoxygalactonokinase
MSGAEWIAIDWGTSRLRAWAMRGGEAAAEARSDDGMARVPAGGFEAALLALVEPWLGAGPVDVVACGMVGAREGWAEAPYRAVPCAPLGALPAPLAGTDPRLRLRILPGLSQTRPQPDVMRGEETQIAGALAELGAGWDGVICLPGTHSKWVEISAGEVVSFATFLTGELFALLSERSILARSVPTGPLDPDAWDEAAFAAAVDEAISRPERAFSRLFPLRAADLLGRPGPEPRAALSGLLLGAELAAARPWWLGRELAVVGGALPSRVYARALATQGVAPRQIDGDRAALAGLAATRSLEAA